MNTVSQHGHCKFELPIEKYLPDEKQKCICDILRVPYSLWSFYIFKKKSIRTVWSEIEHVQEERGTHYFIRDCKLVESLRFYKNRRAMNLSFDEKFFVSHHRDIDRYRLDSFCVHRSPLSLQNWCLDRIGYRSCLPKRFSQPAEKRVAMPEYDREGMRTSFYDACHPLEAFFSEIDTWIYSKEFVVWFQNDEIDRFGAEFKIVHFHFNKLRKRYFVCIRCMKRILEETAKTNAYRRCYYDHEYLPRFVKRNVQNRSNWCGRCKRVPLFHVVSHRDYEKLYPRRWCSGGMIKVELFI